MTTEGSVYCPACGEPAQAGKYCTACGTELPDESDGSAAQDHHQENDKKTADEIESADGSASEPSVGRGPEDDGPITGQRVAIAGAALAGIGAFLPWFSASTVGTTVEVVGIDRDGIYTFVFSIIAAAVAWRYGGRERWGRLSALGVVALGGFTAFLGGIYIYDPWFGSEAPRQAVQDAVQIGLGLYLTLIGGVLMTLAPVYDYSRKDSEGNLLSERTKKGIGVVIGLLLGLFVVALMSG